MEYDRLDVHDDESVETWVSTIVHLGPLPKAQVENEQGPDIGWDWAVEKGFMTKAQEKGLLQYVKEHPGAGDRMYTPQKGTIRTWHVEDPKRPGVVFYANSNTPHAGRLR